MLDNEAVRIKVVHIITGLSVGGAETMLNKLLFAMDDKKFANSVISLTNEGVIGKKIQALGIPVFSLGMKRGLPGPMRFVRLVFMLKKMQPDIVQTWMYHADLLGGIAAKLSAAPVIVWNIRHGDLNTKLNKWSTRITARISAWLSYFIPRTVICNSQRGILNHLQIGYNKRLMFYIGNGFDMDKFKPNARAKQLLCNELGLLPETLLVGLIGRYHPQKDHSNFINAAEKVLQLLPEIHFILAGTGVDAGNDILTGEIKQKGLAAHFHLLGERHDIPMLMAAMDVLCSASADEGFPNIVGEAMSCGIPCVVTDVGDSARIVGHSGAVVPAKNADALSSALIDLLRMPEFDRKTLGKQARDRIAKNFSLKAIANQYQSLYTDLINN